MAIQLSTTCHVPDPPKMAPERIEAAIYDLLSAIGEDPMREGLQGTPDRVARAYGELLSGYTQDLDTVVNGAIYDSPDSGLVSVCEIPFFSLCEHHLLPFHGHAHVAYVPDGQVIGLSKLPRIVGMFSRRLQIQERMTDQIADAVMEAISPKGVVVVARGAHMCATMRGARAGSTLMTTQSARGSLLEDLTAQDRALRSLNVF